MQKIKVIAIGMVILGLGMAAFGQGAPGPRYYHPKTETTVKGTIEEVQDLTGRHGWKGTHLVLTTDAGALKVHVGPSAYVAKKNFFFAKGDEIQVLGWKVSVDGKDALVAREITKQGKTLVLRNGQGIPEWSGGRRWQ